MLNTKLLFTYAAVMPYENSTDNQARDTLVKGLGVKNALEITFHRANRVEDHEIYRIQKVTQEAHHSHRLQLRRWHPDTNEEDIYLLATNCVFQSSLL